MTATEDFTRRYLKIRTAFPNSPERFEQVLGEVYRSVLTAGSTAIDVGAHVGKHTLPMSAACGPTGAVYAFEPIHEKYALLREKAQGHALQNIHSFNVCCSDAFGVRDFTYLPQDAGKSSLHVRERLNAAHVPRRVFKILCVTLDGILGETRPAFIKIDVEGAELSVLRGASRLVTRARPIVHCELGRDTMTPFGVTPEAVWAFFDNLGYSVFDIVGNELPTQESFCGSVDAPRVYDYVAVPRESGSLTAVADLLKRSWLAA